MLEQNGTGKLDKSDKPDTSKSPLGAIGPFELKAIMRKYRDALRYYEDTINRLNVYPVPDGDTGTNMALTLETTVAELEKVENTPTNPTGGAGELETVCKAIKHGSLMGARGNSGVILSQILRAFVDTFLEACKKGLSVGDAACVASALQQGAVASEKALLRPVEGTILTVAKQAAQSAQLGVNSDNDLEGVLQIARQGGVNALARTPELLPVLAQAGVVDAGGAGFLLFLESMLETVSPAVSPLLKELAPYPFNFAQTVSETVNIFQTANHVSAHTGHTNEHSGEYVSEGLHYEVMYFLETSDDAIEAFKDVWAGVGDSIVVVGGDGLWNCHIHTNDIGAAIDAGIDIGKPRDIRVTDLREQVQEERWVMQGAQVAQAGSIEHDTTKGVPLTTAVVAVSTGEGIRRIFRSLGVHKTVQGGQTMNPSVSQILDVVEDAASDSIIILPNNGNIIPTALQVKDLTHKKVKVVPTPGVIEGFAALLEYDPSASLEENFLNMERSFTRVLAAEVTVALRDASTPDGPVKAGNWLGLSRKGIEAVGDSLTQASIKLMDKLVKDSHEIVTIIEGEGSSKLSTRKITEWLEDNRPGILIEVHEGGQPLYPYLFSIE